MGVFCLSLPHTPPPQRDAPVSIGAILGRDALGLLKERSFAVFVVGSFLICIPLSFYFSWANVFLNELGVERAASKMTLGQVSDVIFLLLMPALTVRLGVKKMLLLGMLAWALRFALFAAYVDVRPLSAMLYAGILLHGICYNYVFVMGRVYVDRRAPAEIRGTAQGLIAFVTLGAGMFVGSWLSGVAAKYYTVGAAGAVLHRWGPIWTIPAVMSAVVFALFAVAFHDTAERESRVARSEPGPEPAVEPVEFGL
jgi:nucleoside transporter